MDNLPVVVKEILESTELQKIKKVDLKNISIEVLIGTFNAIPYVGGVVASYLQIARSNRDIFRNGILQKTPCVDLWYKRFEFAT